MRRFWPDALILLGLLLAPLLVFLPVTLGGQTLIPADNLYQYEPWATHRAAQGVPDIPENALVSDLIFQNYQWKQFIRESIAEGEIPLWQPNQFAGSPFLATGQHAALYPFSIIYYVLPLHTAYGWFTVSQLWLAGVFMFFFVRGIGLGRGAGLVAGLTYQLSAFMLVGAVHPMIQSVAAWLPLILLMLEWIIAGRPAWPGARGIFGLLPWALIGGGALGMAFLAGHIEITYYTLIIMALYAALRLVAAWLQKADRLNSLLQRGVLLLVLVALGFGLGAAQFIPFLEVADDSFRTERSTLDEVQGFALPPRHIAKWLIPDIYGNPTHYTYFDVFEWETREHAWQRAEADGRITRILSTDYGIKNYVEGGVYAGLLPLLLAVIGLGAAWLGKRPQAPPYRLILVILGILALLFAFGTPFYAVLYYLFPGVDQLHTPFRWAYLITFVVAVLAAFGVEALVQREPPGRLNGFIKRTGELGIALGGLTLVGLLVSRVLYDAVFGAFVERVYNSLAGAANAFPNAEAFYSYQFGNVAIFGAVLLLSGLAIRLSRRDWHARGIPVWLGLGVAVLFADLWLATGDFNPSVDPNWLEFTPPAVAWLQAEQATSQADGAGPFRIQAYDWGERPLIANTGWRYGLQDVRGYDSLFSLQYARYMERIAPQTGLDFNRIHPVFYDQPAQLLAPEYDRLNVRYFVTDWIIRPQEEFGVDDLSAVNLALAAEFAGVRIYENLDAWPRAYALPPEGISQAGEFARADADPTPARVAEYGGSTVITEIEMAAPGWLILSDTYAPGWRAFVRPLDNPDADEREIEVQRVGGNFRAVALDAGDWSVRWDYSPQSFQLGAFTSFITGMLMIFLALVWGWRTFISAAAEEDAARRVVKNSVAPIALNLFNRGIDFAFAFIMLRILGPADAGIYYYAIVIFGWFDILTNFGLNTFLTREVARDPSSAGRYLANTTALRLGLALLGLPLLGGFLFLRNQTVSPGLDETAMIAILLLYIGLIPNSISTGLSALFYAFEKAEYPAALATVSTLFKVSLGLGALLLGWGVIGLAGVSIITNLVTMLLMTGLALPLIRGTGRIALGGIAVLSAPLMLSMLYESFPLMLNHFLATIFFKIDIVLMEPISGVEVVGVYSTAYKWLDALNIIPAFFTMALLPLLSRQAHEDHAALRRNYAFGFKALVMVALPVAVATTFMAPGLIGFLGGPAFLPDGGIALQIMIWSIPLGWINSLTQYVLIALDRQRQITLAFIVAVGFNIITNLIFIPQYGFRAAAVTTIFSEAILLVGFYWLLRRDVGAIDYIGALWRPILASGVMLGVLVVVWPMAPILALGIAMLLYPVLLAGLKPLTAEENARLGRILPGRLQRWFARV